VWFGLLAAAGVTDGHGFLHVLHGGTGVPAGLLLVVGGCHRGERQHVAIAVEPNMDAFRTYGPPVCHPHDAATATGDVTGAFSHAHPRLHTTPMSPPSTASLGNGSTIALPSAVRPPAAACQQGL
jgi:hypothetical protein